MKAAGTISRAPYKEVFLKWENLKLVLVAISSFLMAQGAIWWCAFSYSQIFLERFMKLPGVWANLFLMGATLVSIPLYVFFGWLSDRIGRKPVLILGMVLSVVAMFPAFKAFSEGSNPALLDGPAGARRSRSTPTLPAARSSSTCSAARKYETACDICARLPHQRRRRLLDQAG